MNKLNKTSIMILVLVLGYFGLIASLKSSFKPVEALKVHCLEPVDSESKAAELNFQQLNFQKIQVYSWDLEGITDKEIPKILAYLESAIQKHKQAVILNIQGLKPRYMHWFKPLLLNAGGCWAYAPLWHTPHYISWLQDMGIDIYAWLWGEFAGKENYEHGLWTAIIGQCTSLQIKAERWALPARPGPWPQRILHRQPAVLALEIKRSDLKQNPVSHHINKQASIQDKGRLQILHLKLADTRHKHQAGALALQSLKQEPLAQRFKPPWLMLGDWRVNPPESKPHSLVNYRFQRFSVAELSKHFVSLIPQQADPQQWGRWRLNKWQDTHQKGQQRNKQKRDHALTEASIIDLAYASEGSLSSPFVEPKTLPWVGHQDEKRAPLLIEWSLE